MLNLYVPSGTTLSKVEDTDLMSLPESTVWLDMINPTLEEDRAVERLLRIAVPTREEMQ